MYDLRDIGDDRAAWWVADRSIRVTLAAAQTCGLL
jgi:hypothetical protein